MPTAIITLLISLVTFFLAKKSGASTTEAALLATTAGGLTYAALSESDWDATNVKAFSSTSNTKDVEEGYLEKYGTLTEYTHNGKSVYTIDGKYYVYPGDSKNQIQEITVEKKSDGSTSTGSVMSEVGSTLRSWGAAGTSLVIGTTKAATSSKNTSMMWLLAAGVLAFFLLTRSS